MTVDLFVATLIGVLFGTGAYLMMRRSTTKLLLGLVLFSNATNLVVFVCARMVRGRPPLIPEGEKQLEAPFADPLGQALILTAIVISFGVLAFAMVLARRGYDAYLTDDTDCMVEDQT